MDNRSQLQNEARSDLGLNTMLYIRTSIPDLHFSIPATSKDKRCFEVGLDLFI